MEKKVLNLFSIYFNLKSRVYSALFRWFKIGELEISILLRALLSLVLYFSLISQNRELHNFVTNSLMRSCVFVFDIFGDTRDKLRIIHFADYKMVNPQMGFIQNFSKTVGLLIGKTCNGIETISLSFFFFLFYPKVPLLRRLIYVVAIPVLLYIANLLRIIILVSVYGYNNAVFVFFHDFLLKYLYILIFVVAAFKFIQSSRA